MSALTRCNRCTLDLMRRKAAQRGATVHTFRNSFGWTSAQYSDENEAKTHFLRVTTECVC